MLFVLLIFVGFCFYYLKTFVVTKPHGVIVFIVPGLDPELLTLARMRSTETRFHWFGRKNNIRLSLVDAQSDCTQFADLPAILTTLASGERGPNQQIGMTARGQRLDNLLYSAQRNSRTVGLVTTGRLTSPGVAAFYAHVTDANDEASIARFLLDSSQINILLGGGSPHLIPAPGTEGRDLTKELVEKGYTLVTNSAEFRSVPTWITRRLVGVVGNDHMPTQQQRRLNPALADTPSLTDMVIVAIECLQLNLGGYLLVVEDPLLGMAATKNQAINAADQLNYLDWTIANARAYAGDKAMIFVYSPYSVGGLQINGPVPADLSTVEPAPYIPELPAPNKASSNKKNLAPVVPPALPILSWHNGPGGKPPRPLPPSPKNRSRKSQTPQPAAPAPDPTDLPQEPAAYDMSAGAQPSAGSGFLFYQGPGLEKVPSLITTEQLHQLINEQL